MVADFLTWHDYSEAMYTNLTGFSYEYYITIYKL